AYARATSLSRLVSRLTTAVPQEHYSDLERVQAPRFSGGVGPGGVRARAEGAFKKERGDTHQSPLSFSFEKTIPTLWGHVK
ncbi:hypothetical protein B0H17DRAFT_1109150, partial [Mycena rosella]